jgi:hypothetical protein
MGRDAAEIRPKLIPDEALLPRDNSGGLDMSSLEHTADWDDGGFVMGGEKRHLSADGAKSGRRDERANPNSDGKRKDRD